MEKLNVNFFFLNNSKVFTNAADSLGNITDQSIVCIQTIGSFVSCKSSKLRENANFYYQTG